jgi:hypothetical protein
VNRSSILPHVQITADDDASTPFAGLLLPGELARRTGLVERIDRAVDAVQPFKQRRRGHTGGEVLAALAESMLAGGSHVMHLLLPREDEVGSVLRAVPNVPNPFTAYQLLQRFTPEQCRAAIAAVAAVGNLVDQDLGLDAAAPVTLDIDTTPTEVYGTQKEEATRNREGKLGYLSHFVTWDERHRIVAAELFSGSASAKPSATRLLKQGLAALPPEHGPVSLRADSEYAFLDLMNACRAQRVQFGISVPRHSGMWSSAYSIKPEQWRPAIDMHDTEVAETTYLPKGWKHEPLRLIIRRVRHDAGTLSSSVLARRRRTIPKLQLALAMDGGIAHVWSYSFILTDKEGDAAEVELWQRQRAHIEERNKDAKLGCGLIHLPLGSMQANRAWQVAAVTAVNLSSMLSAVMLSVLPQADDGGRLPRALFDSTKEPTHRMTATMRRWMIAVSGRITRRGRQLHLHLPRNWPWASRIIAVYERLRLVRVC